MGISLWQLAIVLVIVLLLFGTKKLRNLGSDLGAAVKGFKSAVKQGADDVANAATEGGEASADQLEQPGDEVVIEGEVAAKERDSA